MHEVVQSVICKLKFVNHHLTMCSWSRWADILKHGHFKHQLDVDDIKTISRAMVSY